jgi:hypothetical protein
MTRALGGQVSGELPSGQPLVPAPSRCEIAQQRDRAADLDPLGSEYVGEVVEQVAGLKLELCVTDACDQGRAPVAAGPQFGRADPGGERPVAEEAVIGPPRLDGEAARRGEGLALIGVVSGVPSVVALPLGGRVGL